VISLFQWVTACFALLVAGRTLWWTSVHFNEFITLENTREFSLPILLSVGFLPFVILLSFVVSYSSNVHKLKFSLIHSNLYPYALRKGLLTFGLNISGFRRWVHHVVLFGVNSEGEVDSSILNVCRTLQREAIAEELPEHEGWQPQLAKRFLESTGLPTGDYHENPVDWSASSLFKNIGKGYLPNNIAYYITGDARAATELKLKMNVNLPIEATESDREFINVAAILYRNAMKTEPSLAFLSLIQVDDHEILEGNTSIRTCRVNWLNGLPGGFDRTLTFRRGQPSVPLAE
jgi:hypothetical protein